MTRSKALWFSSIGFTVALLGGGAGNWALALGGLAMGMAVASLWIQSDESVSPHLKQFLSWALPVLVLTSALISLALQLIGHLTPIFVVPMIIGVVAVESALYIVRSRLRSKRQLS